MVSIIMPAFNAEKFIEASIKSVLAQTYNDWELLVINDGSTDSTKTIVETYSKIDGRIILINQDNKKMAAARNAGIRQAKGNWIGFLDSDDLWEPTKLEKQLTMTEKFPDIDVFYTDGWIFSNMAFDNLIPYPTITGKIFEHNEMYALQFERNYIPVLSVLVKKKMIKKVGPQNEGATFSGCEDWDYWVRMAKAGASFYGISEKLFFYRKHGNSISDNNLNMILASMSVLLKNYHNYLQNNSDICDRIVKETYPLISRLLKANRLDDATYILNEVMLLSDRISFKYISRLISYFGRSSHAVVALIGKIVKFIVKF